MLTSSVPTEQVDSLNNGVGTYEKPENPLSRTLVHTSRVRKSMRCCPNAVLFPSTLRCSLKLNEYSKGLTFTLIMPNNTFQSQSKDEQEWYVELLQKLQYVILQQQEELALGLFNRCRH